MVWLLKERFENGCWKIPFLNTIASGKIAGHEVDVVVQDSKLVAYVGDVGIFERPFSEAMAGLDIILQDILSPDKPEDEKPPADVGTKPGAGNPKPTKTRNGAIQKAVKWLENELMTTSEILMKDAESKSGFSNGSIWQAVMILTNEQPSVYEYYKDMTVKYHLKGIRKIEVV